MEEPTKSKSPGYAIQTIALWATILGVLISTYFAYRTIRLTIQLDRTDKKVDLLKQVVIKADSTNQHILNLIREVRNSQIQNDTIISELIKQNVIQNYQLYSLNKHYSLARETSFLDKLKSLLEFNQDMSQFREFIYLNVLFNKNDFLSWEKYERADLLHAVSNKLDKLIASPVVYSNEIYLSDWDTFKRVDFHIFNASMAHYNLNDTVNIQYDGELIVSGEDYLNKVFDRFKSDFQELEKKTYHHSSEWYKNYIDKK